MVAGGTQAAAAAAAAAASAPEGGTATAAVGSSSASGTNSHFMLFMLLPIAFFAACGVYVLLKRRSRRGYRSRYDRYDGDTVVNSSRRQPGNTAGSVSAANAQSGGGFMSGIFGSENLALI